MNYYNKWQSYCSATVCFPTFQNDWVSFFSFSLQTSSVDHDITFFTEKQKLEIQPQSCNQINKPTFLYLLSCYNGKKYPGSYSKSAPHLCCESHSLSTSMLQLPRSLSFIINFTLLDHFYFSFISIQRNLRISYSNHFLIYSPFK